MKDTEIEIIDASNETLLEWVWDIFNERYVQDEFDEDEFDNFFRNVEQIYAESRIFYRYFPDGKVLGWSLLDYDENDDLVVTLFTK